MAVRNRISPIALSTPFADSTARSFIDTWAYLSAADRNPSLSARAKKSARRGLSSKSLVAMTPSPFRTLPISTSTSFNSPAASARESISEARVVRAHTWVWPRSSSARPVSDA